MIRRLPLRIRLVLAFTVVIAAVLAATGSFVYLRVSSALNDAIAQGLRSRAAVVATLAQQSDTALRQSRQSGDIAQVLSTRGSVIDSTPELGGQPLVPPRRLGFSERTLSGEPVRLLALGARAQGRPVVVVVGSSLQQRNETLADVRRQLLTGGPAALILASIAGYLLAAAALRPVERMSDRAETISAMRPGGRLPISPADDEISRLGVRLNAMLERLESALDRERTFVANASHELRTPLSLMKTEIELALAGPPSVPALSAALRSAAEETDRLSRLGDDLLLLARADAGALAVRRSDVSARELLETIATRFGRRAAADGHRLDVVAPAGLHLLGDRRLLEQALSNLVENALRHGSGTVTLTAKRLDGSLVLRVDDEGPGFPAAFLDRAFERFSRADRSRSGVGLGLAIVAAVAQAHGGGATASNGAAGGGSVALTLPSGFRSG